MPLSEDFCGLLSQVGQDPHVVFHRGGEGPVGHAHLRHLVDAVARAPKAVGTPNHIEHHFDRSPAHRRHPAIEHDVGNLRGVRQQ